MLSKIISNNSCEDVSMFVITLIDINHYYQQMTNTGTKIYCINFNKGLLGPLNILKIVKIIYKEKPDVIQTWMYHCDFIGIFLKIIFPKKKLIWNIRHSNLVKNVDKSTTIFLANILGKLSFFPNKIICGSVAAYNSHLKVGYREKKLTIIPNGFDTNQFAPNNMIRKEVRKELGLLNENLVIGHIGRANKIKNQIALIEVFSEISREYSNLKLVLIGKGIKEKYQNHSLVIENKSVILIDEVSDVQRYLKSFDLFVLPSLSEGFPNVIGEAMASGVPCISTRVGDSPQIINKEELIAIRNSNSDLEKKILYWLNLDSETKKELKIYSRNRIINTYSINKVVALYIDLYRKIA
ncbi:hypothetical protein BBH88_07260 [Planococcus antarcticus DSM 14505]|uniref:Glycosyl transferase family 1 domain-containing protein n=1 Tax=Planococcus antarcticus DSM 14505 TaxID=1185653 RepID=A0ABM6D3S3_9BACL|nr:glycosyltransferase [Planococcus antarcticus]ANU10115.1 hypothetical protein BBH88_07260 [Planococcus antarcticus DSM 14505]